VKTGSAAPVSCRQPPYVMYEAPILQKQIDALKSEGLRECYIGPWVSKAILAAKPNN
jgi:hypothetical protein